MFTWHRRLRIRHPLVVVVIVAAAALLPASGVDAQRPTPTPALDGRGYPLPFGVQPYYRPDVPLGSGPYKAIMAEAVGLSEHVAYYPADMSTLGNKKLPVVIWGNGSCLYAGNRYRQFLTEIASYGYLVIAGGPMGAVELEVGPQSNPAPRGRGAGARGAPAGPGGANVGAAAPPAARGGDNPTPQLRVTVPMLKAAVDWAVQQHGSPGSPFANRLDLGHIVSMGHSCGGGLAVQLATEDSRVTGLGIWFSGAGLAGAQGNDPASLQKTKGRVIIITGDEQDTAYAGGKATFEAFTHVPVFYGWQDGLQHIGTFGAKNGGEVGAIARNWLEWTTRSDATAGRMFRGARCTLCTDATWHISKKRID